jgi:hypothetical protein
MISRVIIAPVGARPCWPHFFAVSLPIVHGMHYFAAMDAVTPSDRDQHGRFQTGSKGGPGRSKGSRNRHSENFLTAFAGDFEKHGPAVIAKVREEQPSVYLRIAADLLPKEAQIDVNVDILHDVTSTLEAYRTLADVVGADPRLGLRRLKRLAPGIIDVEPG